MKVTFNVRFPHVPCDLISLDAMDQSGQTQEGVIHHVTKHALDPETGDFKGRGQRHLKLGTMTEEHHLDHTKAYFRPVSL